DRTCINELVKVAKEDIKSALILYDSCCSRNQACAQRLFFLQQSAEKLLKALLVDFGIIDCENLKNIQHKVVARMSKIIKQETRTKYFSWIQKQKTGKSLQTCLFQSFPFYFISR
ncbi:MAG TPA: HEPN domain-containing protein, partial [Candidatus Desulfofervidus auxilii]|nr:HEPN domain-containing protein [Candidatus Desulfofervidus auxilii]